MSWVNTTALRKIAFPDAVSLKIVPHSNTLVAVAENLLHAYDYSTLLPLAQHTRTEECLAAHGPALEAQVCHVAVNTASPELSRVKSAQFHVRTEKNYILIYNLAFSVRTPAYEVVLVTTGRTLQNLLPLGQDSAHSSFSAMVRQATKNLLLGSALGANMANIEHFSYVVPDDETRNGPILLVRVTLAKIIKVSSEIRRFWCKLNLHNLIFWNHLNQLQLLNKKTLRSESVALEKHRLNVRLLEYNLQENYFVCLDGNEMSLLWIEREGEAAEEVAVRTDFLAYVDYEVERFVFCPQSSNVLLVGNGCIRICSISAQAPRFHCVRKLEPFAGKVLCEWAPCGTFFVCLSDGGLWKMYLKFGALLFDSDVENSALFSEEKGDFCHASRFAIAPNSMALFLISEGSMFKLDLVRLQEASHKLHSFPVLYDDSYVTIPYTSLKLYMKVPFLPSFQKIIAQMHHINGAQSKKASAMTAKFTLQLNSFEQLSMSYGSGLAISTPTCLGSVANHAMWYSFYNHSMSSLNIVHHFWLDDYLVLVNRYEDPEPADELVILNTCASKFGNVGKEFKFDSDLIMWRHSFKSQILNCSLSLGENNNQTLVILTDDFKLIVMQMEPETLVSEKRLLKASKTIHLSSIKNQISLNRIKDMINIREKHFFFLLNTGHLYLLKNQSLCDLGTQTKNVYELVLISQGVERVELAEIEPRQSILLYLGERIHIYDLHDLLEATETVDMNSAGPISVLSPLFFPIRLSQENTQNEPTLEVLGLEYQTFCRNKHLVVKQRASRLFVLNEFIQHDLETKPLLEIHENYLFYKSYNYCLELLLFRAIDEQGALAKVTDLVLKNPKKDQILVSFLRKIEASHWKKFFSVLDMTPLEYMNELFSTEDVDLCYSFLNVYLNHKREYGDENQDLLGANEKSVVLHILLMLKEKRRWAQFLELCRFIKFLQPEGQIFEDIQVLAHERPKSHENIV